jgi:hypothetical protein
MQSTELSKKRPTSNEGCTSRTSAAYHDLRAGMLLFIHRHHRPVQGCG